VSADLDPTDLLTAEIVKTAENAYRDVQIAFANELALICEAYGANVYTVRQLVNKSPGRAMLLPGAGVGGHCIPKDPWLLIANLDKAYQPRLIPAARAVNDQMPGHVADLLQQALAARGIPLTNARIAVLGYAFREETDDDRESPSMYLVRELQQRGAAPVVHDPYVHGYQGSLDEVVKGAQAAVIMVAHQSYRQLDLDMLKSYMACPILVDGRNVLDAATAQGHGFTYYGIGYLAH
jgi:UDP-N-acetyl-D-mannosaminuronic acid dehydrogenase